MRVPKHIIEGRGNPFPQGLFLGRLVEVKDNWSEDQKNLDYVLTFQDIAPIEGPQVGARPFTQRVTVIFQDQSVVDIEQFDESVPFALQRSAGLITQLARALEFPFVEATPDDTADFNAEEFLENLAAGFYKDRVVGFAVRHRSWKSKTQKDVKGQPVTGISAEANRFFNPQAPTAPAQLELAKEVTNEPQAPETGPTPLRSLRSRK